MLDPRLDLSRDGYSVSLPPLFIQRPPRRLCAFPPTAALATAGAIVVSPPEPGAPMTTGAAGADAAGGEIDAAGVGAGADVVTEALAVAESVGTSVDGVVVVTLTGDSIPWRLTCLLV